jgi:hypothetical protein
MAHARSKIYDNTVAKAGAISLVVAALVFSGILYYSTHISHDSYSSTVADKVTEKVVEAAGTLTDTTPAYPSLDTVAYDAKILALANHPPVATSTATTTATSTHRYLWPVKTVYPGNGAILPFSRIVAYYGNFYSTKMGVLGEYPKDEMLAKLHAEVVSWKTADPSTPVIPAIHYIVTVAQGSAGADGDWTARMPDSEIQKALALGKEVHGIVFLDVQAGQSTIQKEVSAISEYLKLPDVHLGIDPEFAMHNNRKPGDYIGTLDAKDINDVIAILSKIVDDNHLPPKILIIHRFTEDMVTNAELIKPTKEVQVVMNMDGWGTQTLKTGIYRQVVAQEPVQFTGIKLFYKNDLKAPSTGMLTPSAILKFRPQPSYIQYQ